MIPTTDITRPAIRYYGGKWRLAPWIIKHFPKHRTYNEPCGGAASVMLQKPRAHYEIYNDLNGNVVNFFRVLRDNPDELIRKINLTPWARDEYNARLEPTDDPTERARRFWVGSVMSINGVYNSNSGIRGRTSADNIPKGSGESWFLADVSHLEKVAERFKGVMIENRDFFDVVHYNDSPDNLVYFDPPYVAETRSNKKQYDIEVNNQFHLEAALTLRELKSYVVVSGYACQMYADIYEAHGWTRADRESQVNGGSKKTESLWLSPRTARALAMPAQLTLI